MSEYRANIPPSPINAQGYTFVIVQALFNREITDSMVDIACRNLSGATIHHHTVGGALEIPIALQWCFDTYKPSAMLAFGCVIRGETYHFEWVANESARAISSLSLSKSVGIANGILTCNTESQAKARIESVAKHCAHSAVLLSQLQRTLISSAQ